MKYTILLAVVCVLSACGQNKEQQATEQPADTTAATVHHTTTTHCYLHTEGSKNRDSTFLQLSITDNIVRGTLSHLPYEKDRSTGELHGTKDGDIINATWVYMQEGMQDSMTVSFKLGASGITQKQASVDATTGRMYLADTGKYSIEYVEMTCR
jgi:hypothetical protein